MKIEPASCLGSVAPPGLATLVDAYPGLTGLRKKCEERANRQIEIRQGLKPTLILLAFSARLKSCPVTKLPPCEFFRSLLRPGLFSIAPSGSWIEDPGTVSSVRWIFTADPSLRYTSLRLFRMTADKMTGDKRWLAKHKALADGEGFVFFVEPRAIRPSPAGRATNLSARPSRA